MTDVLLEGSGEASTAARAAANAELRDELARQVRAHGGQVPVARELGVDQALLSKFLSGQQSLGPKLARQLVARWPGLRKLAETALLGPPVRP